MRDACAVMVHTRADQLLPQLLKEHFDTLLTQCKQNENMHEVDWLIKNTIDKMTAMRS